MKGIAMGSLLSSILAEIYLQYFEELIIKHWIETHKIIYYKRYVDDISLYLSKIKLKKTQSPVHEQHTKHLEFKLTEEENKTINYLDPYITQKQQQHPTRNLQKAHTD